MSTPRPPAPPDPLNHFSRHSAFVKLLALLIVKTPAIFVALGSVVAPVLWLGWLLGWW